MSFSQQPRRTFPRGTRRDDGPDVSTVQALAQRSLVDLRSLLRMFRPSMLIALADDTPGPHTTSDNGLARSDLGSGHGNEVDPVGQDGAGELTGRWLVGRDDAHRGNRGERSGDDLAPRGFDRADAP